MPFGGDRLLLQLLGLRLGLSMSLFRKLLDLDPCLVAGVPDPGSASLARSTSAWGFSALNITLSITLIRGVTDIVARSGSAALSTQRCP